MKKVEKLIGNLGKKNNNRNYLWKLSMLSYKFSVNVKLTIKIPCAAAMSSKSGPSVRVRLYV